MFCVSGKKFLFFKMTKSFLGELIFGIPVRITQKTFTGKERKALVLFVNKDNVSENVV